MTPSELWATAKHYPEGLRDRADEIRQLGIRFETIERILTTENLQAITRLGDEDFVVTFRLDTALTEDLMNFLVDR